MMESSKYDFVIWSNEALFLAKRSTEVARTSAFDRRARPRKTGALSLPIDS